MESSPADAAPEKGLLSLRYEAENLTYQELDNASKANAFDKIHAMPKAVRSKISIEIYEDGTSDWRLEKMRPTHDVSVQDQTPPSHTPQTHVTRLSRTGQARFYNIDGRLLKEESMPIRSFSHAISRLRHDPSIAYSILGIKSKEQINQLITEGQRNGATIQHLGNGTISIRSAVTKTAANGARVVVPNYTTVDIINQNVGVLVGSSLYDDKNQLVNQVFYRYKLGNEKQLMPDAIHQKSWTTAPKTGETYITVSNTYFNNVSVTTNLN